jgi:hypothetical protein
MRWYKRAMGLWEDIAEHGPKPGRQRSPLMTPEGVHSEFQRRDKFVSEYAWGVPSKEAIDKIVEFTGGKPIVEVGAGKGLWAKLLQDAGAQVTATDDFSWENKKAFDPSQGQFTEVLDMKNEEAAQLPGHDALMMVWPPYDDPMAQQTLEKFQGDRLVLVGESRGGCTGDDCFHRDLGDQWDLKEHVSIPQWQGIHDDLSLWVRKPRQIAERNKAARDQLNAMRQEISRLIEMMDLDVSESYFGGGYYGDDLDKLVATKPLLFQRYNEAAETLGEETLKIPPASEPLP